MSTGRASFDVQVQRAEHWTTEEIRETESAARAVAKTILAKRQYDAVRVVKYWQRADGIVTETVVFSETAATVDRRVTISQIDSAPYCSKTREYYRLESRETINRLFRKYLDKVFLTPTELIHSYKALRRVQEVDGLFPQAVDRVATLQAQAANEESKTRRDDVYRAVAKMTRRAQKVEEHPNLPVLKGSDLEQLVAVVQKIAPPDDVDYYALVALSRDLMQHGSWMGKFDRLAELTSPALEEKTLGLLDGIYADLFGIPSALQEFLGPRASLAEAICALVDLWEGKLAAARPDLAPQLDLINRLIAAGRLPQTRASVMERISRQISGGQPLCRANPDKEKDAFRAVLQRLFDGDTLLGGSAIAAALTRRYIFLQEAGGKTGLQRALAGVLGCIADSLKRVNYLQLLADSDLAEALSADIELALEGEIMKSSLDDLAAVTLPPTQRMQRATRLYELVGECHLASPGLRTRLCNHIDELLVGYIEARGLIAKLDDPNAPLHRRALRLLEFSAARVLPHGSEAHRLARARIVALLKQPNFEARYIEGITDPAMADQMLRQLHQLLSAGGFRSAAGSS